MTTRAAIGVATSELVAVMVWWFMRSQALAGSSAVNATLPEALGQSWQILIYVGKLLAPLRLNVMPGPDIVTMGLGGGALLALGVGLAVARSLQFGTWPLRSAGSCSLSHQVCLFRPCRPTSIECRCR